MAFFVSRNEYSDRLLEEAHDLLLILHAYWDASGARAAGWPHPLKPLVKVYVEEFPVLCMADVRPDPMLPASLAMVSQSNKRAPTLYKHFSPAAQRRGQLVIPGFPDDLTTAGPALPIQLYLMGNKNPRRPPGRGAPLSMRLFLEAILALPMEKRACGPVGLWACRSPCETCARYSIQTTHLSPTSSITC